MAMSSKQLEIDTLCCNAARDVSLQKNSADGGDTLFAAQREVIQQWCKAHSIELSAHHLQMLVSVPGHSWKNTHVFMTLNHEIQAALREAGI